MTLFFMVAGRVDYFRFDIFFEISEPDKFQKT
jgi:hypothetical protein